MDPFIETSDLDVQDAKDAEIKALKKEIEELKKQLVKKQDPIDIISSEEEIIFNKPLIVKEDPYNVIIKELKDQEEWMADFVRQTKPKKKINKKQIKRDIFEIDFMCD